MHICLRAYNKVSDLCFMIDLQEELEVTCPQHPYQAMLKKVRRLSLS